jgi:cysteine desulfurase
VEFPIYMDHAATTPLDPRALEAMLPFFGRAYGNPASLYSLGAEARDAVDAARERIAEAIGAAPEEIHFTSGGTEADNWALKGMAAAAPEGRRHILTSSIEHHAVLDTARTLGRRGYEVEFLPVDAEGLVEPAEVASRIRTDTLLVSIMHANNEVGTIQPAVEIGALCRERGVPFHLDAVQTFGKLPLDVRTLHASLVTLSAHKIYGPKGVGALYVRRGTKIESFFEGGEQEFGRRAGTLNVPGIAGFGKAVEAALLDREEEQARLAGLRDRLITRATSETSGVYLNGSRERRLSNNIHLRVDGVEGESLLLSLDMAGIAASAGSACTSGSTEPSHVLLAMGIPVEQARGAIRLTLGRATNEEAVDYVADRLRETIGELRALV